MNPGECPQRVEVYARAEFTNGEIGQRMSLRV